MVRDTPHEIDSRSVWRPGAERVKELFVGAAAYHEKPECRESAGEPAKRLDAQLHALLAGHHARKQDDYFIFADPELPAYLVPTLLIRREPMNVYAIVGDKHLPTPLFQSRG